MSVCLYGGNYLLLVMVSRYVMFLQACVNFWEIPAYLQYYFYALWEKWKDQIGKVRECYAQSFEESNDVGNNFFPKEHNK